MRASETGPWLGAGAQRASWKRDTFIWNFRGSKTLTYRVLMKYWEGLRVKATKSWVWQPPAETIDAIAAVLSAHWTAAKSQQLQVFWPRPGVWLSQLTTLREAADSSGTLPDPHP